MADYSYKAKNLQGKPMQGRIKARSEVEAKKILKKKNLRSIVVAKLSLEELDALDTETPILGNFIYRDGAGDIQLSFDSGQPEPKDVVVFTKQLATMLGSGVSLIQSLSILKRQQESKGFKRALRSVQESVENGETLSQSLAKQGDIFDPLYVAMVEAGEASGNLDVILKKLVSYMEKAVKIKNQVKSALMYPLIVFFVAFVVVSGLLLFVVPTFAEQYAESGRQLPGLTQAVIDFSTFVENNWHYIFGGTFLFIVGFNFWKKTERGRVVFDRWILRAPVIGILLRKISVGRFCSTMASMLTSGVNLLQALSICASSAGNKTVENFVLNIRGALEEGSKFSEPLSEGGLFPDMVISMVTVGEETGALDEMLLKVSDYYEEEVDLAVATMLSMIEPIMIVFIGGIIAFIVVAMYLPVFDMAGGIS